MARIKVPQADGQIGVFDGGDRVSYKVKDGEIDVDDVHVAAILAALPGSELKPEPPANPAKQESPAKEN
jgi:hypothetical protein